MNYIHFGFALAVSLWLMPMVVGVYGDSYDSSSYIRIPRQMTIDEAMNTGRSMPFTIENTIIPTSVTLQSNDVKSPTVNYDAIAKQMTIDEVANMGKFAFASSLDNGYVPVMSNNEFVNDSSVMKSQSISGSFSDSLSDKINAKFAKGNVAIMSASDLKSLSSFSNLIPTLPGNVGNMLGNIAPLGQTQCQNLTNQKS